MTDRVKVFSWGVGSMAGVLLVAAFGAWLMGQAHETAPQEPRYMAWESSKAISFKADFPKVVDWTPAENKLKILKEFPDAGEICVVYDYSYYIRTYCFSGRDLRAIARQMQENIRSLDSHLMLLEVGP